MPALNPDYVRIVASATNQCPYFTLLNMKLLDFDIGSSLIEIDLGDRHLQPFGVVHGGVFSSIIDAAAFWCVYPEVPENSGLTTVDLKLNYLAPASSGKLVARGHRIKLGKTLGLGEAEVTDETGRILAHGTSTLIVLPDFPFVHGEPLPRKFEDDHRETIY
ncbi:MAG TPA: PaaI family thioesterase [Desulfomonilaceae bacterium]|nr:PaaI family thioesterase [Desulfomonilaceae bacterium]